MPSQPTVSFHTLGCRLNQAETATIAKSFQARQYEVVPFTQAADVCVINTCTVTEHSDAKNRQAIRAIHRQNPHACIAVIGCYPQMEAEGLQALAGVKLVMGNAEKLRVVDYIEAAKRSSETLVINPKISRNAFTEPVFQWEGLTTRSYLKVQDGCDFMCSFCVIPFSRGRSRSRKLANLLEEAQGLVEAGSKEIVLTGVNLGTYAEESHTLMDVVDALQELPNLLRIRISSIEPTTVQGGLIERMADASHKLVPFLHLPLQSGSATILAQMKRRYNPALYRKEVFAAYEKIPDLCVGTDVMVGFPGETEEAFGETWELLASLPLAYFHVFPFSERKGTPALRLAGKVLPEEKKRRGAVLRELSVEKRQAFYEKFIGTTRLVLLEAPNATGEIAGYTDNYIKVKLSVPASKHWKNQRVPVLLEAVKDGQMFGTPAR